ncbi:right-handed parallel beta-helix repeat-containing protein [Flavimarina sp. Hel_I_48]|uniref:right-handed parallel beta-helix repeat-containing protein n=1 Tax=Flavimarina sp. Hel_I_48 TaxID=1392488 RepID=UPI0004DFB15A|nr:right-handed parallel beta-helix repeat-containing protein [Flavimarina sp. Hel_I_48]
MINSINNKFTRFHWLFFLIVLSASSICATPIDTPPQKTESYTLDPKAWHIVEGEVTDAVALKNRIQLEAAFQDAVAKQADTFKIGALDAYFDVVSVTHGRKRFDSWKEAITMPANFNLVMRADTHLRVQPNNSKRYALLSNGTHDNITITGGNLYGERNTHKYSGKSSDEWGHVLDLIGLENGVINGVTIKEGNGDGMVVREHNFTYAADHDKTRNIIITNCTFDNNRRNNLAITGGQDILVEKNTFLNAGQDTPTSKGTSPKAAIDVEPYKERSKKTGKLIHYEKAEGIVIRNNIEKNSRWQGFVVATGRDVLIEKNTMESSINFGYSDHIIIRKNTIINPGMGGVGMTLGEDGERVFENEVYDNVVKNFKQAISVRGSGHKIHNNKFTNFTTGLRIYDLRNTSIYNNTFFSELPDSNGLYIHVTTIDNSVLINNEFRSQKNPLHIFNLNFYGLKDGELNLESNVFMGNDAISIGNSNGINLTKNTFETGIRLVGTNNITIEDNEINAGAMDGIQIRQGNRNLSFTNNKIKSSKKCIDLRETPGDFRNSGNSCDK